MINATLAGLLVTASGLALIRCAWRKQRRLGNGGHLVCLVLGWLLIGIAGYLWSSSWGTEFGAAFLLGTFSVIALIFVTINASYKPRDTERREFATNDMHRVSQTSAQRTAFDKWGTFIAAGPVAGIASSQVSLFATQLLPMKIINQTTLAITVFPVLWAGLAYYTCAKSQPWKLTATYTAAFCAALCGLMLLAKVGL